MLFYGLNFEYLCFGMCLHCLLLLKLCQGVLGFSFLCLGMCLLLLAEALSKRVGF